MFPSWATHIATNSDGTVYAFSGEPGIFEISDGVTENGFVEVWEPVSDEGYYQFLRREYPDMFWRESMIKLNK